jgi:hypothetical protein
VARLRAAVCLVAKHLILGQVFPDHSQQEMGSPILHVGAVWHPVGLAYGMPHPAHPGPAAASLCPATPEACLPGEGGPADPAT